MADQFTNWTREDVINSTTVEEVKDHKAFIPCWFKAGYDSKTQAIDAVIAMMKQEDMRISQLGLTGPIVKKSKHKRV